MKNIWNNNLFTFLHTPLEPYLTAKKYITLSKFLLTWLNTLLVTHDHYYNIRPKHRYNYFFRPWPEYPQEKSQKKKKKLCNQYYYIHRLHYHRTLLITLHHHLLSYPSDSSLTPNCYPIVIAERWTTLLTLYLHTQVCSTNYTLLSQLHFSISPSINNYIYIFLSTNYYMSTFPALNYISTF